jgi:hypothetical protein
MRMQGGLVCEDIVSYLDCLVLEYGRLLIVLKMYIKAVIE